MSIRYFIHDYGYLDGPVIYRHYNSVDHEHTFMKLVNMKWEPVDLNDDKERNSLFQWILTCGKPENWTPFN